MRLLHNVNACSNLASDIRSANVKFAPARLARTPYQASARVRLAPAAAVPAHLLLPSQVSVLADAPEAGQFVLELFKSGLSCGATLLVANYSVSLKRPTEYSASADKMIPFLIEQQQPKGNRYRFLEVGITDKIKQVVRITGNRSENLLPYLMKCSSNLKDRETTDGVEMFLKHTDDQLYPVRQRQDVDGLLKFATQIVIRVGRNDLKVKKASQSNPKSVSKQGN